jgi:hypothetical protein
VPVLSDKGMRTIYLFTSIWQYIQPQRSFTSRGELLKLNQTRQQDLGVRQNMQPLEGVYAVNINGT